MPVILASVVGVTHQEVHDALFQQWPDYGQWLIDPVDGYDYGAYVRDEWRGESDLVIVEHDVIPPPSSIIGLLSCPLHWCAHEVDLGGHLSARTLGLVKFSRDLQQWKPELAEMALPRAGLGYPPVPWRSVDSALTRGLDFAGVAVHVHRPPAEHLHRYPGFPPAGQAPATSGTPA